MLCKNKRRALGLMACSELVVNKPRASSVVVISHHAPGQEGSKGPVGCCSNKGYQPKIQQRLTDSLEEKLAARCPEVPRVLRKPKVHHRVHKSATLFPVLKQTNPLHAWTRNAFKVPFNIACPSTPRSFNFSISSGFICYTFVWIFLFPCACCTSFFFVVVSLIIFKEECKLWMLSLSTYLFFF